MKKKRKKVRDMVMRREKTVVENNFLHRAHIREGDRYKDRGEKGGKLAMRNIGRRERERKW